MSKLDSLTRRVEKLQAGARARYAPSDLAVIFYDPDRPAQDQDAAQIPPGVTTVIYLPYKETEEENAAHYAAMSEAEHG